MHNSIIALKKAIAEVKAKFPLSSAMLLSSELEEILIHGNINKHLKDVPWITLPTGYSFKGTFPFTGACVRFRVRKDSNPKEDISVYLDTADVLGFYEAPYWEAYPIKESTARFDMANTKDLIETVVKELDSIETRQSKDRQEEI